MPKSKRERKVSLTRTARSGLSLKQHIIKTVREYVAKYNSIYVFNVYNMRNELMKNLRVEWKDSRFFFGKNHIVALAFGRNFKEEIGEGLHRMSAQLKDQCGLLFTDKPKQEVINWFDNFQVDDYACFGSSVNTTVRLFRGPLPQFSHVMEPHLLSLGLPICLQQGVVTLLRDYTVCKKHTLITAEQAEILKLLEYKLAPFRLVLKAAWTKNGGFQSILNAGSVREIDMDEYYADVDDDDDE